MEKDIEIICLGSGSSGNAYVFKKENEAILVECGFELKSLMNKLIANNVLLSSIKACIITHAHKDHSQAVHSLLGYGIKVYAPSSVYTDEEKELTNANIIEGKKAYILCDWLKVLSFEVAHDCESYGYAFLDTETKRSILFINDTALFDFPFKTTPFDTIMVECNHVNRQIQALLQTALNNGKTNEVYKYKRQAKYHLSLLNCKKLLNQLNLSKTKAIILIHLSQTITNDVILKEEIKSVYGIRTLTAKKDGGIN